MATRAQNASSRMAQSPMVQVVSSKLAPAGRAVSGFAKAANQPLGTPKVLLKISAATSRTAAVVSANCPALAPVISAAGKVLSLAPKALNLANHITQAGLRVEGLGQALTARVSQGLARSAPAAGGAAVLASAEVEGSVAVDRTAALAPAAAEADRAAVVALADSFRGYTLSDGQGSRGG